MAATREMLSIAARVKPGQVTLVPERPHELTTTGGLDVVRHADVLKRAIARLGRAGVKTSLFIDADGVQVRKAHAIGAAAVEINTGPYADAIADARPAELKRVERATSVAIRQGLEVLRRPRIDLRQRAADRRDPADRGAQHWAQHRVACCPGWHGACGSRNGPAARSVGPKEC